MSWEHIVIAVLIVLLGLALGIVALCYWSIYKMFSW